MTNSNMFIDVGSMVVHRDGRAELSSGAAEWMASRDGPVGLLSNPLAAGSLVDLLRHTGAWALFDSDRSLLLESIPVRLPDPRAFAIAAAVARCSVEDLVFASADEAAVRAAEEAGAEIIHWSPALLQTAALLDASGDTSEPPAATYVLQGRVVTMDSEGTVIPDGRVVVRGNRITGVFEAGELPDDLQKLATIETRGTIYPGLLDLHNHFAYNVLPLWAVPKAYTNRDQWRRHSSYAPTVTLPLNILANYEPTARALVRYVEGKALIGGTTTGQGIRTRYQGVRGLHHGGMRNVEDPGLEDLPDASTRILDMRDSQIESFRKALKRLNAYFYHLSEGVDDHAHERFLDLQDNGLLQPSLVGIHSLALNRKELTAMRKAGAKVVWSPYSNLLLYGATLKPSDLAASEVIFSIGCDWTPTGSKNLLGELKIARAVVQAEGGASALSDECLVRAVTSDAARVTAWDGKVGVVAEGTLADLIVVDGRDQPPYAALIDASEKGLSLVIVDGVARSGAPALMRRLHPGRELDEWDCDGAPKYLYFQSGASPLDDVAFSAAIGTLERAMSDLHHTKQLWDETSADLQSLGLGPEPRFAVELDDELAAIPDALQADLLAPDWSAMPGSIPLDSVTGSGEDYLKRVAEQQNIPDYVREALGVGD